VDARALPEALDCVWLFLNGCIEQYTIERGKAEDTLQEMTSKCLENQCPCLRADYEVLLDQGMATTLGLTHLGHQLGRVVDLVEVPRGTAEIFRWRNNFLLHGNRIVEYVEYDFDDENTDRIKMEHRQAKADAWVGLKLDQIRAKDKNAMRAIRSLAKFQDFPFLIMH